MPVGLIALELICFLFFVVMPMPPRSMLFPYTTLFRSHGDFCRRAILGSATEASNPRDVDPEAGRKSSRDRKSTRLNSSHTVISYAVFCLKKKSWTLTLPMWRYRTSGGICQLGKTNPRA